MKKLLLSAAISLGAMFSANAQTTIMSQTFGTTIPTGWTEQATTVDAAWEFGTSFGTYMGDYVPVEGDDAFVDDWDNNSSDTPGWDTLKTASINCSTYAHVFLTMNYMFWQDDGAETATIIVSSDGGHTWNVAANLPDGGGGWANNASFNLSAYAGGKSNVMIGFTYYNGYASTTNGYVAVGMALEDIKVIAPLNYDAGIVQQNLNYLVPVNSTNYFTGVAQNFGGDSITSMDIDYSVNGGTPVSDGFPSIPNFNGNTTYNFWDGYPWTPTAIGNYTVKFWVTNMNGFNISQDPANDTLTAHFMVVDSVEPKVALLEEFMQASCNPCMYAAPNLDAVLRTTVKGGYCNPIRYHVDWPGTDYMNDEIQTPFIGTRVTYYDVQGVPDSRLDGNTDEFPGTISVANIQQAAKIGSPFKITINSYNFDLLSDTYSANISVEAYGAFNAGLVVQAVLTVDTIVYAADQSTEDPASSFPGTNPDSLEQYVLNFPNVAEDMMPSSSGTALAAFTPESTQTLTLTWAANHPWGSSPKTYLYDSAFPATSLVVFVQTNTAIAAAGIPAQYVFQSALSPLVYNNTVGIHELTNGVYFNLYPNPSNGDANVAFSLDKSQNVSVEVYDVLGQIIYSENNGTMSSGQHLITIPGSGLNSGVYFVKFTTDNVTTTKKLVIQK